MLLGRARVVGAPEENWVLLEVKRESESLSKRLSSPRSPLLAGDRGGLGVRRPSGTGSGQLALWPRAHPARRALGLCLCPRVGPDGPNTLNAKDGLGTILRSMLDSRLT